MANTVDEYLDRDRFEALIERRAAALGELREDARDLRARLRRTKRAQADALARLTDYHGRYARLVLDNVLLLQRWWRGHRTRVFFKTVLRKEVKRRWAMHQVGMRAMEDAVGKAHDRCLQRMAEIQEQSNRDAHAELMEQKRRELYQIKKSQAVTIFENVLGPAAQHALGRAVVNTLGAVKEPIFNKELDMEDLKDLASYFLAMKAPDASGTGRSGKRLQFAPSLADRVSKSTATKYNVGAQALQETQALAKKQEEAERIRRMQTVARRAPVRRLADCADSLWRFSTVQAEAGDELAPAEEAARITIVEVSDVDAAPG